MERGEGTIVKMDADGGITVPEDILNYLAARVGDKVTFEALDLHTIVMSKYNEDE